MALGAERGVRGTQAGLERKAPKTGGSPCTRGWPSTLGLLHPCPLRSAESICHPEPLPFQTPLNGFCAPSIKRGDSHRGGPSPEAPRQLMERGLELCLLKPAPGQRVFLRQLTPHQGDWYWLSPWRLLTSGHRVLSFLQFSQTSQQRSGSNRGKSIHRHTHNSTASGSQALHKPV